MCAELHGQPFNGRGDHDLRRGSEETGYRRICVPADFADVVFEGVRRRGRAITPDNGAIIWVPLVIPSRRFRIGPAVNGERGAVIEDPNADGGDAFGYDDRGEGGAVSEGATADGGDAARDGDRS